MAFFIKRADRKPVCPELGGLRRMNIGRRGWMLVAGFAAPMRKMTPSDDDRQSNRCLCLPCPVSGKLPTCWPR